MANEVESHLATGDCKETWRSIKSWYHSVEDCPPKPNYQWMEALMQECINLYMAETLLGALIPINVNPFAVNDNVPTDGEIQEVVKCLCNGRAGGLGGTRAEHLKWWLSNIKEEEREEKWGRGNKWRLLVQLIGTIWERGSIPLKMTWMVIVLLPKGRGDYHGIELLEPIWKVVEVLMDKQFLANGFSHPKIEMEGRWQVFSPVGHSLGPSTGTAWGRQTGPCVPQIFILYSCSIL
jgi:hypothetical protein